MLMKNKPTIAVIGAGSRGLYSYPPYILKHPDKAAIVAVAEPREFFRNEMVRQFDIAPANIFTDWRQLLSAPRLADAVMITVQDELHKDIAVAAANKGYDILLEKPMAVTAADCMEIYNAVKKNGVKLCVCHVLRYAPFFVKVKEIIDSGVIGEVATIQHTEGVGWWHQAHSYVRGNWRNEKLSSFMLLAKSCHDMDILSWWVGKKCVSVASFGHLKHFKAENKPACATDRCMTCPLADDGCSYSAKKFYMEMFDKSPREWPINVLVSEFTREALIEALNTGQYGRCVYACDNDVVDNQVVIMDFKDGVTANFTMTAFTPGGRQVKVMGTEGCIEGDEKTLRAFSFRTKKWQDYDLASKSGDVSDGHGGGDFGLMAAFIEALQYDDESRIRSGADQTISSHLMTFAAEEARLTNKVVVMDEFVRSLKKD